MRVEETFHAGWRTLFMRVEKVSECRREAPSPTVLFLFIRREGFPRKKAMI